MRLAFLDLEAALNFADAPSLNPRDFANPARAALPFADFGGSSRQPTTTTTQNTTPWVEAQPYLRNTMHVANQYLGSDTGYKPWTGPANANLSAQTQGALSGIEFTANQGQPLANTGYSTALNLLNNQGLNAQNNVAFGHFADVAYRNQNTPTTAQRNLSGIAQTGGPSTAGDYRSLLSGLGAPTAAQGYADPIASGAQGITTGSGYNASRPTPASPRRRSATSRASAAARKG
jgi:hypothetical protein